MKTNIMRMFLALGAACVCGSPLVAQSYTLSAKVPFAFDAAGKDFPAGKYLVREVGNMGVPSLQSAVTGQSVFIAGANHALTRVGPPRLVFHCYSGSCFLAEIWPTTGSASRVAMTKAEKEILHGERSGDMASISVDLYRAD